MKKSLLLLVQCKEREYFTTLCIYFTELYSEVSHLNDCLPCLL